MPEAAGVAGEAGIGERSAVSNQQSFVWLLTNNYVYLHRKTNKEGDESRLLLLFSMSQEITSIQTIENLVTGLLDAGEDVFLVSVKIKPVNNIKVFLDADSGLSIDKCIKINRAMYKAIEEKGWYSDGNFSLEVSSPGIDEPLLLLRQYKKNTGRLVEVTLNDATKKEGKLLGADDTDVTIETTTGKGKKAVTQTVAIPFGEIKQTKVQIVF